MRGNETVPPKGEEYVARRRVCDVAKQGSGTWANKHTDTNEFGIVRWNETTTVVLSHVRWLR
jgi:hypothetical protein